MKPFLKSAFIWSSAITAVLFVIMLANSTSDTSPEPLHASAYIVVWILVVILTIAYKFLRLARRFGSNLGHELVKNPKGNIGDTFTKAGKSAMEGRWKPPAE